MTSTFKKLLATTFLVTMVALPVQAQDEELQKIVDRLERMDRDIKALNLKVYRGADAVSAVSSTTGEDVSGPLGARLSVRINELESQLRSMNGQIEETAYRISQLNTRLDKLVADVDYRLTALEGGTPASRPAETAQTDPNAPTPKTPSGVSSQQLSPVGANPQPTMGSQPGTLGTLNGSDLKGQDTPNAATPEATQQAAEMANLTPEQLYQEAHKLLARGDYNGAKNNFDLFLEKHSDHKLAGNVRHWIGELFYAQGNYTQAASVFLKSYQQAPRGAKAPDSLLKLGMSLARMDKQREACASFDRLRSSFPKLPAHLSKTLERERTSAKCS